VFYWQKLAQNAVIHDCFALACASTFRVLLLLGKILKNYKNFLAHTTGRGEEAREVDRMEQRKKETN